MSTSSCVDVTAPAVLEWESNNAIHYLSEPDPPRANTLKFKIQFLDESRFSDEDASSLFRLCIPVRLKGVDSDTHIILPIESESIFSFDIEMFPTAPLGARRKLHCSTICLRFQLDRPLDVIVPTSATVPLQPKRTASGKIIDALRSLSCTTAFAIYLPDKDLPKAKAQAIHNALSQSATRPPVSYHDLPTLFNGNGGKILGMTECLGDGDSPPTYDQVEPPPPMAPIFDGESKKRRRMDEAGNSDDIPSQFSAIWARLDEMQKEKPKYEEQISQLQDQVEQLKADNQALRNELDDFYKKDERTVHALEQFEDNVSHLRIDLDELEDVVKTINENGLSDDAEESILNSLTDRFLEHISAMALNATVSFSRP